VRNHGELRELAGAKNPQHRFEVRMTVEVRDAAAQLVRTLDETVVVEPAPRKTHADAPGWKGDRGKAEDSSGDRCDPSDRSDPHPAWLPVTVTLTWDGRDEAGTVAPDGPYDLVAVGRLVRVETKAECGKRHGAEDRPPRSPADKLLATSNTLTTTVRIAQGAATVNAETGGTVTVTDWTSPIAGATVDVPPNALPADTSLYIYERPGDIPPPPGHAAGGPRVTFGPDGTTFAAPVTVGIPYSGTLAATLGIPETAVRLFRRDEGATEWTPLEVTAVNTSANLVYGLTDRFSDFEAEFQIADPALTTVEGIPPSAVAGGFVPARIVVTPRDETGAILDPGQDVTLACAQPQVTLGPVIDAGDGTYFADISSIIAIEAQVSAQVNAVAIDQQGVVSFFPFVLSAPNRMPRGEAGTILGVGFDPTAENNEVLVGGTPVPLLAATAGSLVFQVPETMDPAGATLEVRTNGRTSPPWWFEVLPGMTLAKVGGDGQVGDIGVALPGLMRVRLTVEGDIGVPGVEVVWAVARGGAFSEGEKKVSTWTDGDGFCAAPSFLPTGGENLITANVEVLGVTFRAWGGSSGVVGSIPVPTTPMWSFDVPPAFVVSPGGREAYVVDAYEPQVSVVDLAGGAVTAVIPLSPYARGYGGAFSPDGSQFWLAADTPNKVIVIDVETRAELGNIPLAADSLPHHVLFHPTLPKVYVETSKEVLIFDPATGEPIGSPDLGGLSPTTSMTFSPDGSVYYVFLTTPPNVPPFRVMAFDSATDTALGGFDLPVRLGPMPVVTADGATMYVPARETREIYVFDLVGQSIRNVIALPETQRPMLMGLTADGTRLAIPSDETNALVIVDTDVASATYETVLGAIGISSPGFQAVAGLGETDVFVTQPFSGRLVRLDVGGDFGGGGGPPEIEVIGLGYPPREMTFWEAGGKAYVRLGWAGSARFGVVDLAAGVVVDEIEIAAGAAEIGVSDVSDVNPARPEFYVAYVNKWDPVDPTRGRVAVVDVETDE
ncbi:MAG: hypothetical protein ABID40_05980, partial [Candidatus Bipolaricaulota bacterium]